MSSQNTNQIPSPFRDGVSSQNFSAQIPSPPFREAGRVSKFDTARLLYMAGDSTQRSIAKTLKVSERTVYTWIKNNGWDRLRQAARTAPAVIAENIFSQIVELQNDIASREEGKRYPTMQEAELTRKLVLSVDKMKSAPALSQTMQILRMFRSFANGYGDNRFRLLLNQVIEHFVEGEAKNGYLPYQLEYGPEITPEPALPAVELEIPVPSAADSVETTEKETAENQSEVKSEKSPETQSGKGIHPTSDSNSSPATVGSISEVKNTVHSGTDNRSGNRPIIREERLGKG